MAGYIANRRVVIDGTVYNQGDENAARREAVDSVKADLPGIAAPEPVAEPVEVPVETPVEA